MLMGMIDRELSSLRSRILEISRLYAKVEISRKPRWVEVSGVRKSTAVASDSSFTGILTRYAYIYGIRAFSAPFTGAAEDTIRLSRYMVKFDLIDPLTIRGDDEDEISMRIAKRAIIHMAKDLEVKVAKAVIDSMGDPPDLVLFDGSLRSFLHSGFGGDTEFSRSMRRGWEERVGILRDLMKISKTIFISKTHSRQILYRYMEPKIDGRPVVVPDYALVGKILEGSSGKPGFIEPIKISDEPLGITYTLTYAVLARGSPAYQVTIPGELDPEELVEIFEMLRFHSIPGYPEPLRQCHFHSRIKRSEFIGLLDTYGVKLPTGREPLGEV